MLLGIVAVKLLNLDEHSVSIVGPIKSGLPTLGTPDVHVTAARMLATLADTLHHRGLDLLLAELTS